MPHLARLRVDQISGAPRTVVIEPGEAARIALAARLRVPAIPKLICQFSLYHAGPGEIMATGTLDALVVQEDVSTLEPFEAKIVEKFRLRFVPEADLPETIDPDDPIDDVGYRDQTVDLEEAMEEQLALALDPYPHRPDCPPR